MKRSSTAIRKITNKFGSEKTQKDNNSILIWVSIGLLVLIIFLMVCYSCSPENSEGFASSISQGFQSLVGKIKGGNSQLRDYDIIYFYSPTCPWCKKMTKVLQDASALDSVTMVDISKPEGQKLAKETGAADKGVPAFISKTYKTGTVGFRDSVDDLLKSLDKKPTPTPSSSMDPTEAVNEFQQLQIIVFVSPTCGWCNKLKAEMEDTGVMDMVELVDVSTEHGQQTAKEVLQEFRGVPACYSRTTGKKLVGYKPVGEIIEYLK